MVCALNPAAVDAEKHLYGVPHLHGHPARRDARHQAHGRKGVAGLPGIPVAQAQRADGMQQGNLADACS